MAVERKNREHREPASGCCLFRAPHTLRIVICTEAVRRRCIVRDVYEVLREKEKALEQIRREVEALRLAVQLVNESEGSPANIAFRGSDLETHDTEVCGAMTVSTRLKRMAAPLLATFAR
jgi:hypothetical protein